VQIPYVGADGAVIESCVASGAAGLVTAAGGGGVVTPREHSALLKAAGGVLVDAPQFANSEVSYRNPPWIHQFMSDYDSLTADSHSASQMIRERRLSAELITLSDYRIGDVAADEIDLATAVDVAIRDLREILVGWGSESARQRAAECELTLRWAFSRFVSG